MKVRLTALTPLHIGGREGALNPLEFVLLEGRCYIISEGKLASALQQTGTIDLFCNWFTGHSRPALREFLAAQKLLNRPFLNRVSAYSASAPSRIDGFLRPFVRDAFNRPFLPGSSIKGALRTAFLYKLLKGLAPEQRKQLLDDFVRERLEEYRRDPRGQRGFRWFQDRFKQWFAQRLEADFFQKFTLRENQRRFDPHTDFFRCLRVTDSTPLPPEAARVEEIKIFSARSQESPKRWSLYAECLPEKSSEEFEIGFDEGLLQEFAKRNSKTWFGLEFAALAEMLHNPLGVWAEMGQDLWKQEVRFFSHELKLSSALPEAGNRLLMRVGWGAGLLGTSVDMLLPDALLQDIRNTLFTERGPAPAPKSRRLVIQGNNRLSPLGWVTVEKIEKAVK